MKKRRTSIRQQRTEEGHNWRTRTSRFQDFLQGSSHPDSVVLVEDKQIPGTGKDTQTQSADL